MIMYHIIYKHQIWILMKSKISMHNVIEFTQFARRPFIDWYTAESTESFLYIVESALLFVGVQPSWYSYLILCYILTHQNFSNLKLYISL